MVSSLNPGQSHSFMTRHSSLVRAVKPWNHGGERAPPQRALRGSRHHFHALMPSHVPVSLPFFEIIIELYARRDDAQPLTCSIFSNPHSKALCSSYEGGSFIIPISQVGKLSLRETKLFVQRHILS